MDENEAKARQLIEAANRDGNATSSASLGTRIGQSILHTARAAAALHVTFLGGSPVAHPGIDKERKA